eukprot:INCI18361.1.p1 GENE.INCI18361.1~~INCI18361.1.p1  ORF type:complete len:138 (-),score=17.41 INCI18361.1:249-641(-)
MEDGEGPEFDEPDIVTALSVEEVNKYVRQSRHFIKIADRRAAKQVLSKISTQGLVRKLSTFTLLAAVSAYLAGRFVPSAPPILKERRAKVGLAVAASGAFGLQLVNNSSPFFCYEVVYDREGVMHLSRKS